MTACPQCGAGGRKVSGLTVEHHARADQLATGSPRDGWRCCRTPTCPVGYFASPEDTPILVEAMRTVPFPKSEDPSRLVCFCFEHSARAITEDVLAGGESSIKAAITEACRKGSDDCERKNPEGRCCLGHVAAVIREVDREAGDCSARGDQAQVACCPPKAPQSPSDATVQSDHSSRAAALGAVGAAALSSACCWLPLLLIGLGVSSAGVGAFFEAWRVPLLAVTVSLLGLGFYLVYVRKPTCEPQDACAAPDPKSGRRNKALLWFASVAVAAFALFPEYVTTFTGDGFSAQAQAAPAETRVVYRVEGMTCGGCASHVKTALEKIPGVTSASVSYEASEATVLWSTTPDDSKVVAALKELGYRAARAAGRSGETRTTGL